MKETELKPCPFCGGLPILDVDNLENEIRIFCQKCPAEMRMKYDDIGINEVRFMSIYEAINWTNILTERWNERGR